MICMRPADYTRIAKATIEHDSAIWEASDGDAMQTYNRMEPQFMLWQFHERCRFFDSALGAISLKLLGGKLNWYRLC